MAEYTDVLKALGEREGATKPSDLTDELQTNEGAIRAHFSTLKKKGFVEGSGTEWYINDAGRAYLDTVRHVPITKEDVGEDELTRFIFYGGLAGVSQDLVTAAAELFQNTDMRSMEEVVRVLAEMNIPQNNRTRWLNLYRGFLRNTTPPETRDELYPVPTAEEVKVLEAGEEAAGDEDAVKKGLDYMVQGNDIHRVGQGLGEFTFRQALQIVASKRGTAPEPQTGGGGNLKELADVLATINPNKPLSVDDVVNIYTTLRGIEGAGGGQAPPGFFIDEEGNLQQLEPGQPIVVRKVERQAAKTFILDGQGNLIEQEAGKPVVIKVESNPGGSTMPMVPYPVIGADGEPVLDKDGKPVYANLEPMMKMLGFQAEQRRANERHDGLMALAKTVRENVGDGVAALKAAASEIQSAPKEPAGPEQEPLHQVYACGNCKAQFRIPETDFEKVACPSCHTEYTREQVLS